MTLKHCNGCGEDKELKEFHIRKRGLKTGLCSQCKKCTNLKSSNWYRNNLEKARKQKRESRYRRGLRSPAQLNKSCATYLGCVIAETVLSHEFPGFKRMPPGNPDYDYECPKGFLIDVKSSCRSHPKEGNDFWQFQIGGNKKPHFFLCLAFNNRDLLNIEHLWLIPGYLVNMKKNLAITDSPKGLAKWSKYERSLKNALACCDKMKR